MVTSNGQVISQEIGSGITNTNMLTNSPLLSGMGNPTSNISGAQVAMSQTTTPEPDKTPTVYYLLAVIALIVVLKFASEHEKAKMEPSLVGIGVWNWITVGLLAMTFSLAGKAIFNKHPVTGITQLFNAA